MVGKGARGEEWHLVALGQLSMSIKVKRWRLQFVLPLLLPLLLLLVVSAKLVKKAHKKKRKKAKSNSKRQWPKSVCRKPKPNAKRAIKNSHKQADNKQNALANTDRESKRRGREGVERDKEEKRVWERVVKSGCWWHSQRADRLACCLVSVCRHNYAEADNATCFIATAAVAARPPPPSRSHPFLHKRCSPSLFAALWTEVFNAIFWHNSTLTTRISTADCRLSLLRVSLFVC